MKKFFLVFAVFCVALASATAGVNEIKAQFVSNIPEDNMELDAVTSSSAVSKNWSVPLASSGAFANYGSNWISLNWLDSSNAFAYVQADWADSLMISGGVGKAPAKFRFLVSGSGSPGVNSSQQPGWSADITSPPNYFATPVDYLWGNNLRHTNDWGGFQFDYDIPFSMHSKAYGWSTGDRAGSSLVASRLTHILIPAGATISSGSGSDWLTKVTVVRASLSISRLGPNMVLRWSAFTASDCLLETATDSLSDPESWAPVGDTPTQSGEMQWSLSYPMNNVRKFFRLKYQF